jgi:osmotically inducible protein OsmC
MSVTVLYTTKATAIGGRDGHVSTADGTLNIALSIPKELGGLGGPGNNPEQLFAAGYSACFLSAMKAVAAEGGPKVPSETTVSATVGMGQRSEGGFGLDIELEISLPGLAPAEANALVAQAHQVCPYSNATRNNASVRLRII